MTKVGRFLVNDWVALHSGCLIALKNLLKKFEAQKKIMMASPVTVNKLPHSQEFHCIC